MRKSCTWWLLQVLSMQFEEAQAKGPTTSWFYEVLTACPLHSYRQDRQNVQWFTPTDDGVLEITINLSKAEKDPKAIAQAKKLSQKRTLFVSLL
ncbi:hypothetical protein ACEQPO_28370 [Bacillus sp. SL00103]